ncbi:MAG: cadmium-translocating P-type ATPase [Clostridia bacterium]|nr:cadmium-translocating P-type ATPase [Clostridia bacterium]
MNEEQKKELYWLIAGALMWAGAWFIPEGIWRTLAYIAIYLFVAFEVIIGVFKEFREGEIFSEEFLMTVATVGALILGEFPEAVAVMLLYRVGEWFADLAVDSSRDSVSSLARLRPDRARVIRGGKECEVSPEEVKIGEIMAVQPGERVPLDGVIIKGMTTVDASSLTGESLPQEKAPGDEMFSGCVNISGRVEMRVTAPAGDSAVDRILHMTEEASERKAKAEDFIHCFAKIYTPCVIAAAVLLAVVLSLITGEWTDWVHKALVFLTVSCPCALVVSVPLSFFCGIGCASKNGVLVKGSVYLEALSQAEICAFDKTGTLTTGGFAIKEIKPSGMDEATFTRLAAAAESYSSHPVAKCVAAIGAEDGIQKELVYEKAGMGVCALVEGHRVLAGNLKLMKSENVTAPDTGAAVYVAVDGAFAGEIFVTDDIKPSSAEAIRELKALGIKQTVMLSGDSRQAAEAVGRAVGLDKVYAELLPADKVALAEEISKQGKTVYTGDGINDAPVLAASHTGIAMGGLGSDAAIETADAVIMDDRLTRLPMLLRIARKTVRIAKENIVVSLAVKFAILGVSIFVKLPMYVAIAGDVGVLLLATANALRCWKK